MFKWASASEMAEWYYWFNGHELGQTPGDGKGQGAWHAAVHVGHDWMTEQQLKGIYYL